MATTDPTPSKPLGKVRAYILRIAGLSTTAQKVLRTCNEPNTCANDLNRVISLDPVLTGRVLQLINSAYYSLPSKVNSLTRAIILLGLNTVKNLVLSFAVFESFSKQRYLSGLFGGRLLDAFPECRGGRQAAIHPARGAARGAGGLFRRGSDA